MTNKEIRNSFIDFFKKYDHQYVKSSAIVPYDDPTIMFTNAGMNQFKRIFLDLEEPKYNRVVNYQKCFRVSGKHNDLEVVGRDTYHHTFFEMMGNWSFGDYYKKEAIIWAWELFTDVWALPKDRLYATVYKEDDEAFELWKKCTDIKSEHVLKFDEKDNFWEMGDTGPCGPCSEIHIDLGEDFSSKNIQDGVNVDGSNRFIELGNLVFIQYNKDESGNLTNLPKKHIDTGFGFERLCSILQNTNSNYEIDIFKELINGISEISKNKYEDDNIKLSMRVIADHIRALTFAIADGVIPSNEGRGYVIRRILRRAVRFARNLKVNKAILADVSKILIQIMGSAYPEIVENKNRIIKIINIEEENFLNTLDKGIELFNQYANKNENITGEIAFKLYDTFGFPIDLTQLLAQEKNLQVDMKEFSKFMNQQKEQSRQNAKFKWQSKEFNWIYNDNNSNKTTEFIGYHTLKTDTQIIKFAIDKESKKSFLIVEKTPFYAESGGQVGDSGLLKYDNKQLKITNTYKIEDDFIHEINEIIDDDIINKKIYIEIDKNRRNKIKKNHTATHLLHKALRKILGEHITQQGSLVDENRLRFDFNHHSRLNEGEIKNIQDEVNKSIINNYKIDISEKSFNDAKKEGATALFGEKYQDIVRVIKIDDYSMELCGGTHVNNTSEIGFFRITQETSIASGIRRIEAITGETYYKESEELNESMKKMYSLLNANDPKLVLEKIENLKNDIKKLKKQNKNKLDENPNIIEKILNNKKIFNEIETYITELELEDKNALRKIGDEFLNKVKSGIGIIINVYDEKITILVNVTNDLIKNKNIKAGIIANKLAVIADGRGGGKDHMAMAGAKDISKIPMMIENISKIIDEI